ncbi:ammonia-dependent NAD(+) synthetase [Candidatus Palibaumannia cicadellinicola]|uniref:ammonia-dependent NAD(+) synthetase n=1 Tax=Candidatus Palibaumannia cicadellinicola TaxID=186490 RepID=UPI0005A251C7|nr:ammonia-dependent NAD(+) synthetase [Candidatus Baumannia cicadellinicola]MBS0032726.1 ammonia-dependent NAD(+) synthetase [Candidatus Baumannia cicadellinicola]MCJ7462280.1 ammonia-dependent NAD(+) synthetase [Candidatus Baumannia cicadellinicola]MCJ7462667.1 ammonia-dependent NAD(+) synthetase [Candidatus Baumannia cicadellinicola]
MKKQQEIIIALGVKAKIKPATEVRISIDFLKSYLKKYPSLHTLVLGISGGQDSTLAGKLCQLAIEELRYDTGKHNYQFIAVRLPYGEQKDEADCNDVINFIQPDRVIRINIKNSIQASEITLRSAGLILSDFLKGNEKARERMKVQYSIASLTSGLVVGTNNAAEAITGFFTKYGDGGTDINPLFRLNKRQVTALLQHLVCPQHLYLKTPTADLEDERPALPDELVLGVTYTQIDDYLEGKNIDFNAAQKIEKLYQQTEHKRHLPITIFDDFW